MSPIHDEARVAEVAEHGAPLFAIIVVTYERDEAVQLALESVLEQTVGREQLEVCVVANSPSPQAKQRFEHRVDHWVDSGENLGCSGGRNLGVELTSAPFMIFVDDDSIPDRDFVRQLGEVIQRDHSVLAVRGRAEPLSHPVLTYAATHYTRGPDECDDLLTLEGCACIRRSAFEAVGGYDVDRAYHEGLELSGRLLEAFPDGQMLYTPNAVIRHDYLQGLRHFFRKARMVAVADDREARVQSDNVERALQALRSYQHPDGRTPAQRAIGRVVSRAFRATVSVNRLLSRLSP